VFPCVRLRVCACVAAQVPCGCFAASFCDCHQCVAEDLLECHIRALRVVERRPVSYYVAFCCVALCCVALCCIVICCVISRATPSLLLCCVVLCRGVLCCIELCCDLLCYFSSGLRKYMHLYTQYVCMGTVRSCMTEKACVARVALVPLILAQ